MGTKMVKMGTKRIFNPPVDGFNFAKLKAYVLSHISWV